MLQELWWQQHQPTPSEAVQPNLTYAAVASGQANTPKATPTKVHE